VGEAGGFTSLIGIHLQSSVLQQAGAFLLGRHHPHIKGQRPDPPPSRTTGRDLLQRSGWARRDQLINAADWRPGTQRKPRNCSRGLRNQNEERLVLTRRFETYHNAQIRQGADCVSAPTRRLLHKGLGLAMALKGRCRRPHH
jgi:hypothetical protein